MRTLHSGQCCPDIIASLSLELEIQSNGTKIVCILKSFLHMGNSLKLGHLIKCDLETNSENLSNSNSQKKHIPNSIRIYVINYEGLHVIHVRVEKKGIFHRLI